MSCSYDRAVAALSHPAPIAPMQRLAELPEVLVDSDAARHGSRVACRGIVSEQELCCTGVGEQDIHPSARQGGVNGRMLALAAGNAHSVTYLAQFVWTDADDSVVEITGHEYAVGVEVPLADV